VDHTDDSGLTMDTSYPKSKLGKFMIIGGLLGAGVSLFDRGTRRQVTKTIGNVKDGGASVLSNMRQDPSQVSDQLANYLQNTANNLRTAVQDVTDDMREMAQKVTGMTQSTKQAYQYAIEAGEEISGIASKLRHPGNSLNSTNTGNYLAESDQTTYTASLGGTNSTGYSTSGSQGSSMGSTSTSTSGTSSSAMGSSNTGLSNTGSSNTGSSNTGSSSNSSSSNSSSFGNMSSSNQSPTSSSSNNSGQSTEEDFLINSAVDLLDEI
jgi:hypothetical protein